MTAIARRSPPNSVDAERAVLCSMMLTPRAIEEAAVRLTEEDFYYASHASLFSAICAMYQRDVPVDLVTLNEELDRNGTLESLGGPMALAQLSTLLASGANVRTYIGSVKEKAIARKVYDVARKTAIDAYEGNAETEDLIGQLMGSLQEIDQSSEDEGLQPTSGSMAKVIEFLRERASNPGTMIGVPSGIFPLDYATAGWQNSDLIYIAARPSTGKTALAMSLARSAAKDGVGVAVFSLEMNKEQLLQRMVALEAEANLSNLRRGLLQNDDFEEVIQAAGRIQDLPIYIDDMPGINPTTVLQRVRQMQTTRKIGLVIIDYLQLMTWAGKCENRQQEVSKISAALKGVAKRLNVPVIALSQLSRATEHRTDHEPQLSDLRDSGSLEQDADLVMFLHRPEFYGARYVDIDGGGQMDADGAVMFKLGKHRNGETVTFWMRFDGPKMKFTPDLKPLVSGEEEFAND